MRSVPATVLPGNGYVVLVGVTILTNTALPGVLVANAVCVSVMPPDVGDIVTTGDVDALPKADTIVTALPEAVALKPIVPQLPIDVLVHALI